jgi:amidase
MKEVIRMKISQVPYRLLVNIVGLICVLVTSSNSQAFDLEEATITDLQEGMRMGTYTSRSIVEMYLKRVEEIDKRGPAIRSYLEINPDALAIADQLDQERRDGQIRGPLHGIPVLLKDSIDTADKLSTTGGSYA